MPVTGAMIAADALRYVGKGYVYGGNASAPGDWDCSSFVSYVLGHDLGLPLPGGAWGGAGMPPRAHGPVVVSYANWPATTSVGTPAAGDLCCWVGLGTSGHIGIATSSTEMVSALNPTDGTKVTPIQGVGPSGSPLVYRRINSLALTSGTPMTGPVGVAAHNPVLGVLLAAGVAVAGAAIVTLGATLAGVVVAAAITGGTVWLGRKVTG